MGGNRGRGGPKWSRPSDNPPPPVGMRDYQLGPNNRFNAPFNSQQWQRAGLSHNFGFQRPQCSVGMPPRYPPPFLSKKQERSWRWHEQERMKKLAEERREAEKVKRKEREREEKRKKKEEESLKIAQQEKEQEEKEAKMWAEKNEKIRASLQNHQGSPSQSSSHTPASSSCQVDENEQRSKRIKSKPAWVKMGRGLHELDLPLSPSDMVYVGQGAVLGGESETVQRPTDLPLAPGAAVVLPPGSGNTESSWHSSWKDWEMISNWAPWGMSAGQGVGSANLGAGRKRTLSESSCISNVSFTPRKRRLSEADTVCKEVTEQSKLITPVRKYQVNPKVLGARSNARHLNKQTVDTDDGLDLGNLLELEYSSEETLSEGNRNKESRGCRSKRHGRGWCKFGDNCVVRREGALTENQGHQQDHGQSESIEKKDRTKLEIENQNEEEEAGLKVKSFANVDQLCRSKFHGIGKCKCRRRVSGTEVIVGTVGPAVEEDIEQVETQQQQRAHRDRSSGGMLCESDSDPLPSTSQELNPFAPDKNQDRLRLIFEEEARLVMKLKEKRARLKAEAETRKSINLSIKALLEQLTASERRQEEEEEGIQIIAGQLEYYGKLKEEQLPRC